MRYLIHSLLIPALLITTVAAQAQSTPGEGSGANGAGSISGLVTRDDKPAQGIPVVLISGDFSLRQKPIAKAITDSNGRYKLINIPHGRYQVTPLAPAMVVSDQTDSWSYGKAVSVGSGEDVEGLDFKLERGGVITGHITDSDGRPVIAEPVRVERAKEGTQKPASTIVSQIRFQTDDRGIYRAYGVPTGRYVVSIGESKESGSLWVGKAAHYIRTFYPSATDEAQAKVVEVAAGDEVSGIDITVETPPQSYEVAGHVVDAETGKPVAGVALGTGTVAANGKFMGSFGADGTRTDSNGEFRLSGIAPGRYAVFTFGSSDAFSDEQSATYSDPAQFEVIDSDVSGLEIKAHRGATINGIVAIDGAAAPGILIKLSELKLTATVKSSGLMPIFTSNQVGADGSFHLTGLRPGKNVISLGWPVPKGFSIASVQRDGIDQPEGIDTGPGEQVNGVRVVVTYGTSIIRGQVQVQNGLLPQGARLAISAHRVGGSAPQVGWVGVDALNHFLLDGLSAGDYELSLMVFRPTNTPVFEPPPPAAKQVVHVGDGAEVPVTLILDLNQTGKGNASQ